MPAFDSISSCAATKYILDIIYRLTSHFVQTLWEVKLRPTLSLFSEGSMSFPMTQNGHLVLRLLENLVR